MLTLKKKNKTKQKTKKGQGKIWGIIEFNFQFDIGLCEGYQMDKVKNIESEFAWVLFLQIFENFQVLYVKSIKSKEGNSVLAWDL